MYNNLYIKYNISCLVVNMEDKMKILKWILFFSIIIFFISCILMISGIVIVNNILVEIKLVKVVVFLLDFIDDFILVIGENLKDI